MTIRESEDALFAEWRKKDSRLVTDGVINENMYLSARLKILFLLKEVDDEEGGGWDLRDVELLASVWQTWSNAARWSFGLLNDPPFLPWSKLPEVNKEFRRHWLRCIAAVNIKKVGGGPSAEPAPLAEYAQQDRELLRTQLALYKPKLSICCGTSDYLQYLFTKQEIGDWFTTSNGTIYTHSQCLGTIVNYYHPQARYPSNFLYSMLIDAVKEMLTGNGA